MTAFLRGFLLIALIGAGTLYGLNLAEQGELPEALPQQVRDMVRGATDTLSNSNPQEVTQRVKETTATASSRGRTVAEHTQNVLGAYVQPVPDNNPGSENQNSTRSSSHSSQPIHERALEYAQYQYCKSVVTEWEKKN